MLRTTVFTMIAMASGLADAADWALPPTPPRTWVLPSERDAFRAFALDGEEAAFFDAMRKEFDADYLHLTFPDEPVHFGDPDPTKRTSQKVDLWRDGHWRGQHLAGTAQAATLIWRVTGEDVYLQRAREATLHMIEWDVSGTSGVDYNDEVHYRLWRVFPMVFDQIREVFTSAERQRILGSFRERGRQSLESILANRTATLKRNSLDVKPASHSVRFMAMTGMAGLALVDDLPEAREWWAFAQRFYRDQFPPWGGDDGGWAEGPAYWRAVSTHARFQDALSALGHPDAWQDPFWRNTGYYGVYFVPPGPTTMFGDLPVQGTFGMEAGVRHFMQCQARISQNGFYQSYAAQFPIESKPLEMEGLHITKNPPNGMDYFLRSFRASRMPVPDPISLDQLPHARHFRDIGWVSMHSNLGSHSEDIALSFKASPYGSYSHSHGDQNAFVLRAYGQDLAINSGYREYHRSPHHKEWTRHTRSKNAILINGEGQPVQDEYATGFITRFEIGDRYARATGDSTVAYRANPALADVAERVLRDAVMIDKRYVVIRDHVRLRIPCTLSWLLHAKSEMEWVADAQRVVIREGDAVLHAQLVSAGNGFTATQTNAFAVPVDPKYVPQGYVDQYHLAAVSDDPAVEHEVFSVLWPARRGDDVKKLSAALDEVGRLQVERPDGRIDRIRLTDDQFQLSGGR